MEECREIDKSYYEALQQGIIGKEIPNISVSDLNGKSIRLKKLLKKETIIIFSAHDSSWGKEDAETAFPQVLRKLGEEAEGIDIICLVENCQNYDPQVVNDYAWHLEAEYSKVYLIDVKDARRMNLSVCPTKFFINGKQIVVDYHLGYTMEEAAREQIILNGIYAMRKQKL